MKSKVTQAQLYLLRPVYASGTDALLVVCRPPGNLELKAVPRPSMQHRHAASLNGLRQSKAVSGAVPGHIAGMKQQQTAHTTVPGFVSAIPKESIKWKQENSMRVAK